MSLRLILTKLSADRVSDDSEFHTVSTATMNQEQVATGMSHTMPHRRRRCRCCMEQATDGAETAAIDGLVAS